MSKVPNTKKSLSSTQTDELLRTLKTRFEKNMNRHKGLDWSNVQSRLQAKPEKIMVA